MFVHLLQESIMLFGLCCGLDWGAAAADAGFDYIETTVAELLCPSADDAAFDRRLDMVPSLALPPEVVNCFVPAEIRLTGPAVDGWELARFVQAVCRRAKKAGVRIIVLGSGGARRVDDGFDRARAWEQLADFCSLAASAAAENEVTIALEPLNRKETNMINCLRDGAAMVEQVHHPAFGLLADSYQWGMEDDSLSELRRAASDLRHVHVATFPNRLPPGREPCALPQFLTALQEGGYDGRVSIESGRIDRGGLKDAIMQLRKMCEARA